MLASSAVDHGLELLLGQSKDYKIGLCCICAMHATLRRKSNDWFPRDQDNVFEWSNMSTRGLLFKWASRYKADIIITSSNVTCSRHDIAETLVIWR